MAISSKRLSPLWSVCRGISSCYRQRAIFSYTQEKRHQSKPYGQPPRSTNPRTTPSNLARTAAIYTIAALALIGCQSLDKSYMQFMDGLNERKVRGCYDTSFTFAGGGGLGGGVNGSIVSRGVVVTGGMTLDKCAEYKKTLNNSVFAIE